MSGHDLPLVNACLNGTATVLLLLGYMAIRSGRVRLHMTLMLTALVTSAAFLGSYLYYHFAVRGAEETKYTGDWKGAYLAILVSHILLAIAIAFLVPITAGLALSGRFATHKRIARWTLPIWLYVSVTGVVIYLILKDYYPKA